MEGNLSLFWQVACKQTLKYIVDIGRCFLWPNFLKETGISAKPNYLEFFLSIILNKKCWFLKINDFIFNGRGNLWLMRCEKAHYKDYRTVRKQRVKPVCSQCTLHSCINCTAVLYNIRVHTTFAPITIAIVSYLCTLYHPNSNFSRH